MTKDTATIKDVAREAGVAIGTVARFLKGQPIRQGNRAPIEDAIEKLNYRPNQLAAAMKTKKTNAIGVLMPSLGAFHAKLLEQLTEDLHSVGIAVISYFHDQNPKSVVEGLELLHSRRVDAVVMDGIHTLEREISGYAASGLPIVFYDNNMPDIAADRVMVDNAGAAARLTDHLLDMGHRRIAMIHGPTAETVGRDRLQGVRDAMMARAVALPSEYVVAGDWSRASGIAGVSYLRDLPEPPTAIISANYTMTEGILRWMRESGLRVGRDLSLASFDDSPVFELHEPGITCAAQPVDEIASAIASLLAKRLQSPKSAPGRTVRLACRITLRGSVLPVSNQTE